MSKREAERIADYLEMEFNVFSTRYNLEPDESPEQLVLNAESIGQCPFLGESQECTVQEVKPLQCRTFPFWPMLLDDQKLWEASKFYCPGIDSPEGRLYSSPEIDSIRTGVTGT